MADKDQPEDGCFEDWWNCDDWWLFYETGSDTGTEFDSDEAPPVNVLSCTGQGGLCDECGTLWFWLPGEECICGIECPIEEIT